MSMNALFEHNLEAKRLEACTHTLYDYTIILNNSIQNLKIKKQC